MCSHHGEDKAPESILSLHHESSGDQTLVTGFGGRHLYLLRHFFGPFKILIYLFIFSQKGFLVLSPTPSSVIIYRHVALAG